MDKPFKTYNQQMKYLRETKNNAAEVNINLS